jgi:hypothetical protein
LLGVIGGLIGWIGASNSAWQADVKANADKTVAQLNERRAYLGDIRNRWIAEKGDGIPQMIFKGQGWPPDDWMNAEIAKDNLDFTFHGLGPRFTLRDN